jgi:tetratricopeptide (TPR) repeat protein
MADGKHKKAQSFFEEVEKSRASVYLGGSVESLQFLTDFVRNSYKLGDFKAAEARQERIISGVKKLERQSITLSSHKAKHNLAEFKRRLGKLDEARSLHEANVKFLFEHVGVDHLDPLKAAERLGDTYFDLKMYEEAAEYYQGITENRGKLLGSEHVDTVSIREKLAVVRFKIVQESSEIGEFL